MLSHRLTPSGESAIIDAVTGLLILGWAAGLLSGAQAWEERALFLKEAAVVDARREDKGVTETWRVELAREGSSHRASFQSVDVRERMKNLGGGKQEIDFVDSYRYNIAASSLSRLVGLQPMVPVSVERHFRGRRGAMTWWVDDVLMDEAEMDERGAKAPDSKSWSEQIYRMRVFSELIHDTDRNKGNLLITADWKIWMIDFTRAFRRWAKLRSPESLIRCDARLLQALRGLTRAELDEALGGILLAPEIEGVWARRGLLVEHYDTLIGERGASRVLY